MDLIWHVQILSVKNIKKNPHPHGQEFVKLKTNKHLNKEQHLVFIYITKVQDNYDMSKF